MSLSIEPSNAFLSLLTLASTYIVLLSITPPNPNLHPGEDKSTNPKIKTRPTDTMAITTGPLFVLLCKTGVATLGLIHAILALYYPSAPPTSLCPNPSNISPQLFTINWITLALNGAIIVAGIIRRQCFAELGKSFTFRLAVPKELVTTGIYRYIQHPSYTTLLTIMYLYVPLVVSKGGLLGCWVDLSERSAWGMIVAYQIFIAFHFRIRVLDEEKMLKAAFGKEWEVWHQKTARLIPGLFWGIRYRSSFHLFRCMSATAYLKTIPIISRISMALLGCECLMHWDHSQSASVILSKKYLRCYRNVWPYRTPCPKLNLSK